MHVYYKPRHSSNHDKPMVSMVMLDYTLVSFVSNHTLSYIQVKGAKIMVSFLPNTL